VRPARQAHHPPHGYESTGEIRAIQPTAPSEAASPWRWPGQPASLLFADELSIKRASLTADFDRPSEVLLDYLPAIVRASLPGEKLRTATLAPLAPLAGMHHERLDGTGYHRGVRAAQVPMTARVLAAADTFQALTADRPHRRAFHAERAVEELRTMAKAANWTRTRSKWWSRPPVPRAGGAPQGVAG
jgi:hypothetical protein